MPLTLRIQLFLGRMVDWDKGSLRVILVIIVINLAFAALVLPDLLRSGERPCDAACEQMTDDILRQSSPYDPRDGIDDVLRGSR
ncbi:MAG: hypothetical protein E6Q97_20985 [Desulfurellales bacterium]|nr:MAG: hypothetical protein E6Q97_20985 [Desulfurellales bacterium]